MLIEGLWADSSVIEEQVKKGQIPMCFSLKTNANDNGRIPIREYATCGSGGGHMMDEEREIERVVRCQDLGGRAKTTYRTKEESRLGQITSEFILLKYNCGWLNLLHFKWFLYLLVSMEL